MSSVPVVSAGETSVVSMDHASALMFEDCVERLTAIADRSGQPIGEISHHPAVRPILRKMRSLVNQIEGAEVAVEDNTSGTLATVTDISTRFRSR